MKEFIEELKKITEQGLEAAIINSEEVSKKYYFEIYTKLSVIKLDKAQVTNQNVKKNRRYQKIKPSIKEQLHILAYYFSNYEHQEIYPNLSQSAAFQKAADKLGVKSTYLKYQRDYYDSMNNNHRKGLHPKYPEKYITTKNQLDKKSKEEVMILVKNILLI